MATYQSGKQVAADLQATGSVLGSVNLLQPTGFRVVVDRRNFQNLEFFCQSVTIPAINVNAVDMPYKYVSRVPFEGDKLTFSELTLNILMDEDLNAYTEMYNWLHRIVRTDRVMPTDRTEETPPTVADINVSILTSHNNIGRSIRFYDCVPTSIGDISLDASQSAGAPIIISASFAFSYFEL